MVILGLPRNCSQIGRENWMQHSVHLHWFCMSCLDLKTHLLLLFLCDPSCDAVGLLWVQAKESSLFCPPPHRPSPGLKVDWLRALGIGFKRDDPLHARKMESETLFWRFYSLPTAALNCLLSCWHAGCNKNTAGNSAGSQRVHETPSLADANLLLPVERVNPQ